MRNLHLAFITLCFSLSLTAQTKSPDITDKASWEVINRTAKAIGKNGKKFFLILCLEMAA